VTEEVYDSETVERLVIAIHAQDPEYRLTNTAMRWRLSAGILINNPINKKIFLLRNPPLLVLMSDRIGLVVTSASCAQCH